MAFLTRDTSHSSSTLGTGLVYAVVASMAFGLSGTMARGLMDAGWSAGAAVTVRVVVAAVVLAVPGLWAVRGRYGDLWRNTGSIVVYGVLAVAGAQLCYFLAVAHLQVGVALLIEYTSPVAVVLWGWWRHGHQPGRLTVVGATLAAGGLVLLLDVLGSGHLSLVGVGWALAAMVGNATYFVMSADDTTGLPPITLAAAGLGVGAIGLVIAAFTGLLPIRMSTQSVHFAPATVAWWVPLAVLGLVSAALAYVLGIEATRRLGSRLSSFVSLAEVVAALGFAWLLLQQTPHAVQLLGAGLVLAGVIVVKLGEKAVADLDPEALSGFERELSADIDR